MIFWKTTKTSKPSWTVKHHSQLRNEYYNSAIPKHPTRLAWYFISQSSQPLSFRAKSRKTRMYNFKIQRTISLLLNKDSKPTTQLFCVVKITCGSSRIRTYSVKRQRFYRPPQLSYFGVLPFCLGNRTRTCNLLHPKQANNQSLSSQMSLIKRSVNCGLYGDRTRFSRETVGKVSQ